MRIFQFLRCPAIAFSLLLISCAATEKASIGDATQSLSPDQRFGELFTAVQMARLFPDSKTFADASPKYPSAAILENYRVSRNKPGFDLGAFVTANFDLPNAYHADYHSDPTQAVDQHIKSLWPILTREPQTIDTGSLITLPYAYVVPGGRFREIYYWDSYFTMLGLRASQRWDLIEDMVDNFAQLIDQFGFIPNGNRTYYTTRSQPPFFSLMVRLLAEEKGESVFVKYRPQLETEYKFWMNGAERLSEMQTTFQRVVRMPQGEILNRYWDAATSPRPESYREDIELIQQQNLDESAYRDIRAAAESGWDFSSRWFKDGRSLATINTTNIVPVDLNALLYQSEITLADAARVAGDPVTVKFYQQRASQRQHAIINYCWNSRRGFFFDYRITEKSQSDVKSLAAAFPLYVGIATAEQASAVARTLAQEFLQAGGLTTTLENTHQQWDAPNGWAPLQLIAIAGLQRYGHQLLAKTIRERWLYLNTSVYQRTGKMLEKYNVYDIQLEGGGGEYPVQDGFGWTNGVFLELQRMQRNDGQSSDFHNLEKAPNCSDLCEPENR